MSTTATYKPEAVFLASADDKDEAWEIAADQAKILRKFRKVKTWGVGVRRTVVDGDAVYIIEAVPRSL